MRPRFANRGSPRSARSRLPSYPRFNEAPIRESGKFPERPVGRCEEPVASMRPRFANRGSQVDLPFRPFDVIASMRPRFANRGSPLTKAERRSELLCFNEAPIRESGKSQTAGSYSPHHRGCFNEAPIRESGKSLHGAAVAGSPAASMRPRFANRGSYRASLSVSRPRRPLQ